MLIVQRRHQKRYPIPNRQNQVGRQIHRPPPKSTALDLLQPGEPEKTILLSDYIEIRELAEQLHLKPFKVVADVMELKQFKHADELIDFETASIVSRQHGYIARRIL